MNDLVNDLGDGQGGARSARGSFARRGRRTTLDDVFWEGYAAGVLRQRAWEAGEAASRARLNVWLHGVATVVAVVVAVWSPFWWWIAALWALAAVVSVFAARGFRARADLWRARGDVIVNRFKEETE